MGYRSVRPPYSGGHSLFIMQRKAFNFYKSYYDVFFALDSDADKLQFITALLKKQFENIDPTGLQGMAFFAYKSQEYNIKSQVDGYLSKKQIKLPYSPPTEGAWQGALVQEEEKEKGKEKGEEKVEVNGLELEKCKSIALRDDKWIRLAKTNETELDAFNDHCILLGKDKNTPIDYKRHFVNWKKMNPAILVELNKKNRDDSW